MKEQKKLKIRLRKISGEDVKEDVKEDFKEDVDDSMFDRKAKKRSITRRKEKEIIARAG